MDGKHDGAPSCYARVDLANGCAVPRFQTEPHVHSWYLQTWLSSGVFLTENCATYTTRAHRVFLTENCAMYTTRTHCSFSVLTCLFQHSTKTKALHSEHVCPPSQFRL